MTTEQTNRGLPRDANEKAMPLTPAVPALAVTNSSSLSSNLAITLNISTSMIEVNALSQGIFMRWGAAATSSAFDEYIQAGSTRHYVVPTNLVTGTFYTTVQFIQQATTATVIVIEK